MPAPTDTPEQIEAEIARLSAVKTNIDADPKAQEVHKQLIAKAADHQIDRLNKKAKLLAE